MCLARARVQVNLCPSHWWCIDICWYLDLGPSHRKYKCTLSHVDMSALLLKLQTEREKREALEHEVDIKRRLEERSVVQSAADYKQTLFSEMLHVQLYLRTGSTVRDVSCRTYRRFHATLTGIQAVSSQSCCAPLSRTSDKPTASSSVLLTTSQRQTMST